MKYLSILFFANVGVWLMWHHKFSQGLPWKWGDVFGLHHEMLIMLSFASALIIGRYWK